MTDYTNARYWAITGLGYGRGFTPEEAVQNYREIQRRNFPDATEDEIEEAWGRVWQAPEGTTGFSSDGRIFWEIDGKYVEAEQSQVVGDVGRVPEEFATRR